MSDNCQKRLMLQGVAYPRTCIDCGLGPCKFNEQSFKDHPKSITELKAEKALAEGKGGWGIVTPRDLLIEALREIDSGEWKPELLTIVVKNKDAVSVASSSPDMMLTLGLLSRAMHIHNDAD